MCLEREVRKEMAENKRRWELVQDVSDLEPDFTTHSWKQAKSIMSESMSTAERNLQFKDKISIKDDNPESCEGKYKMISKHKYRNVTRSNSGSTITLPEGKIQYLDVAVKEQIGNEIADHPEVLEAQDDNHYEKDVIEKKDDGQKRRLFKSRNKVEQLEEEIHHEHINELSLNEGDEDKKSNESEKLALNVSNSSTEILSSSSSGNKEVPVSPSSPSIFLCKPEVLQTRGSRKGSAICVGKREWERKKLCYKGSSSMSDSWK